jgi:hypothetical protein
MDIYKEFIDIITALQAEKIDFTVCGGFAMALHGLARFTQDIDLLVREADVDKIVHLMKNFGFLIDAGIIPLAVQTRHAFQLRRVTKIIGQDYITLDLLIVGPSLEDVWQNRIRFDYAGNTVPTVSVLGLAKMKRLSGRLQDLADIERLGINPYDPAIQPV